MIARAMLVILAPVGISLVTGCSPYVEDYHYTPHPAVADIQATSTTQPSQPMPPPVTAYATVVGIRRQDDNAHLPLSVEVRLRLDNRSQQPVTFDPRSLDLTNGELVRFPAALAAPQMISVLPNQPVMVQANFPFPPGLSYDNINLQALQLRWTVRIDSHDVPQFADFRRVYPYYGDPYYAYPGYGYYPYPYYGYPYYGVGGTIIIRR